MSSINSTSTSLNQTSTPANQGPPLITLGIPATPLAPITNNFAQYESPTYRFTIQYPHDWRVEEGLESETAAVVAFFSPLEWWNTFDTFAENFNIAVGNIPTGTSLDDYGQAAVSLLQFQPPDSDFELIGVPASTTFGGLPAQEIGYTTTLPNNESNSTKTKIQGMQLWTINDNYVYTFSFGAEQGKFSSYLPTIQKIIDTFRITNSTQ